MRGDVGGLVVVYDKLGLGRLPFYLETPLGEVIDFTAVPPGFQTRYGIVETARFAEFRNPPGEVERYAGTWHLVIKHEGRLCRDGQNYGYWHDDRKPRTNSELQLQFGYIGEECFEYDDPVDYGFSIGVGSNLRMQAYVTPGVVHIGEPILLTAVVSEAGLPVRGCNVSVRTRSPSGVESMLTLHDDGVDLDGEMDDGEYANQFTGTHEAGGYQFFFRATGYSRDGEPMVREVMRSKYVEGTQPVYPPENRPKDDECCRSLRWLAIIGLVLLFLIVLLMIFRG
jgi:hypothetical protein